MRIISGRFKGHKLASFDEGHIRPTTDRVKESLFNILQAEITGARVLDLFSGTGNLGLEALSREAEEVHFVESNPKSIKLINKNIEILKIKSGFFIHREDVLVFLKEYRGEPFDVVFVDPPFPAKVCKVTLELLGGGLVCSPKTLIAIEHSRHEPLEAEEGELRRIDTRHYGDKILSFYSKKDV